MKKIKEWLRDFMEDMFMKHSGKMIAVTLNNKQVYRYWSGVVPHCGDKLDLPLNIAAGMLVIKEVVHSQPEGWVKLICEPV